MKLLNILIVIATIWTSGLVSTTASAGEDWPFRCKLQTNWDVTEFYIYESDRRDSGYELSFYNYFGARRTMEVWLEYDPSGEFYTFSGSHMTKTRLTERHLRAVIPTSLAQLKNSKSGVNSHVKFKMTFPGGAPRFDENLGLASCTRFGSRLHQEVAKAAKFND